MMCSMWKLYDSVQPNKINNVFTVKEKKMRGQRHQNKEKNNNDKNWRKPKHTDLIDWFEEFMLNTNILNDGFNHQIGTFDHPL